MDRVQSLTQAYSQAPWRKQMQIIGLFLLVLVFIALIAGLYLNLTARAGSIGREIQSLQDEIDVLEQTNIDMQSRLAFMTSAEEMENRARSLGFERVENGQPLYLVVPEYGGRPPAVLAPAPGHSVVSAPVLPPEYTESLFVWLQKEVMQSPLPFLQVKLFEVKR